MYQQCNSSGCMAGTEELPNVFIAKSSAAAASRLAWVSARSAGQAWPEPPKGFITTGVGCESLALAAVGTGSNTTAWAAGTQTGEGLEAGAAAARRLGASPGKAAHVAGVSGCAIASSLVDMRAKG